MPMILIRYLIFSQMCCCIKALIISEHSCYMDIIFKLCFNYFMLSKYNLFDININFLKPMQKLPFWQFIT